MTLRVHVHGSAGRMGRAACDAIDASPDMELCGRTGRGDELGASIAEDAVDVLVEFTVAEAFEDHAVTALDAGVGVVSGTTGVSDAALARVDTRSRELGLGVLVAPNFAIGVLLMQRFSAEAARHFDDVEIIEMHHQRKLDAPSGTARDTARRIRAAAAEDLNRERPEARREAADARGDERDGVPIHSIRLPGLVAHQEVIFGAVGQTLSIRHDTLDRGAFMPGLLLAVRRIRGHVGLLRSIEPWLFE